MDDASTKCVRSRMPKLMICPTSRRVQVHREIRATVIMRHRQPTCVEAHQPDGTRWVGRFHRRALGAQEKTPWAAEGGAFLKRGTEGDGRHAGEQPMLLRREMQAEHLEGVTQICGKGAPEVPLKCP